jgi:hypothetical protein
MQVTSVSAPIRLAHIRYRGIRNIRYRGIRICVLRSEGSNESIFRFDRQRLGAVMIPQAHRVLHVEAAGLL